jgi:hypothetical protein
MPKRFRFARVAAAVALVAALPATSFAWGTKEHVMITRLAAEGLIADPATPPAMRQWLIDAQPQRLTNEQERAFFMTGRMGPMPRGVDGLAFWSVMPDLTALTDRPQTKVEPYGAHERLLHYIDVEYFGPNAVPLEDEKPRPRAGGGPELMGEEGGAAAPPAGGASGGGGNAPQPLVRPGPDRKPAAADFPRDVTDRRLAKAGYLPFRVRDCYDRTVRQIRAGRLIDRPGQFPRDEHATKWAGMLAHYVADNTQPHHATIDYQGRSFFPPGVRVPSVHSALEYKPVDDEHADYPALRERYWALLQARLADVRDLAESADPFDGSIQTTLISYDALPMVGAAAVAAWDRGGKPDEPRDTGRIDVEKFYDGRGTYLGREMSVLEMKAHQQAWAVKRIQRLWRAAWDEATRGRE